MGTRQRSDTQEMNFLDSISPRQNARLGKCLLWALLVLSSCVPRILAAFLLPNEEGDPYSYFRAIQMIRASLIGGTFTISELFGFWLPLYQFICALISALVGNPLYVAKLVSAVAGTAVCLLVFWVSLQLTSNRLLSLLAFALIAFNPIHIMYSAFSMSDVPHAFLVMSSLCFVIRDRWVLASIAAAFGGLMRPESWLFIGLMPALQWLLHRRVSPMPFFFALSAPLLWIYISWAATGNPLEYFNVRNDYLKELIAANPSLGHVSFLNVMANLKTLIYSAGPAVIIACSIAAGLLIKRKVRQPAPRETRSSPAVVATVAYFFSSLGFLLFAYFTKQQPAIFARYCLVMFALGLPVLVWTVLAGSEWKRPWALGLSLVLAALCIWQFAVQLRDGASYIGRVSQKQIVANYLKDKSRNSTSKIFCDDDTVKVMACIAADRFVTSSISPSDPLSFLNYLRENRVEYLVYEHRDGSAAETLFGSLGEERIPTLFQLVATTDADLRLYRMSF